MFSLSEQLTLASKAVFEAQLTSAQAFAQAAVDIAVTAVDMNVDAAKSSLAAGTVATRQLMAIRDPQEWASLTASQSQLAMERVGAYGRQAAEVAQGARASLARVAETQGAASKQKVSELVDVVKKVPTAVVTPMNSFLKTAFDGAHAGYDRIARVAS
ncbi:MAG TPA: hypothetical protein DCW29_03650 [Janthinobacterium sp.]|nr:hypothetical protein [Janthinobacterium sp.]